MKYRMQKQIITVRYLQNKKLLKIHELIINAMVHRSYLEHGTNDAGNDTNGVETPLNKEQTQIEKLLQIIEKNPFATQAYYAEEIGVSKRTVSRMFASLQKKGRLVQNGTKSKLDNYKVGGARVII